MLTRAPLERRTDGERPAIGLMLGPAGSGKTRSMIDTFLKDPDRSLMIVSSSEQAETRVGEIVELSGAPRSAVERRVFGFGNMVSRLYGESPAPRKRRIGQSLKRMALADIVAREVSPGDFLASMRDAPGFVPALAERIREWKLCMLSPEQLERGGAQAAECIPEPSLQRKSLELSRLYRAYMEFLNGNNLIDEEDCIISAATIIRADNDLFSNARYVAIDGMYRFNRAERHVIAALAANGPPDGTQFPRVIVSLPFDPDRPLLFAAPGRTIRTLEAEFDVTKTTAGLTNTAAQNTALGIIGAHLFGNATSSPKLDLAPSDDAVSLIDVPNAYAEAEIVAREFRKLHDRMGYRWRDLAVILRIPNDYLAILAAVFERYDIPVGLDSEARISDTPPLRTVLTLFEIVLSGWHRDPVLAFLKSSFTAPSRLEADSFRRAAAKRGVRCGMDRWLTLSEDEDCDRSVTTTMRLASRYDSRLRERCVRPLDFADAIREIAAELSDAQPSTRYDGDHAVRDRLAMDQGLDWLHEYVGLASITGTEAVTIHEFLADVKRAWSAIPAPTDRGGDDQVFVTEPYYARKRPIRAAAVMGLTERTFPRRITEDPFLRDAERVALHEAAGIELEPQKLRTDDERLFFYLAVTAPTDRLILSYPRSSQNADTLPSFYLDEIRAVFGRSDADMTQINGLHIVSRTLADVSARPDETVNAADSLLAACVQLSDQPGIAEADERLTRGLELVEQAETRGLQRKVVLSTLRSRSVPALPRISDPLLRAEFGGGGRVFGVSELETYRKCPFQYLMRHGLRLREEQDGATLMAQGSLLHAALTSTFRSRSNRLPVSIGPLETSEEADTRRYSLSRELFAALELALAERPLDAGPHRVKLAVRLLTEALAGFAEREVVFAPLFGFVPAHFELAFGFRDAVADPRDDDDRDVDSGRSGRPFYDPGSVPEPLVLSSGNGTVRVCGSIDRVDVQPDTGIVLALDYKLGPSPDFTDMQRGASLQMPLYMLALERVFGRTVAIGCYDSMREPGRRRICRTEHIKPQSVAPVRLIEDGRTVSPLNKSQFADLIQTAEAAAVTASLSIAEGIIDATPGRFCGTCAYGDVCRTTESGGHDGERIES